MRLEGKTALVTGAARGIGRGCAVELAAAGADVVLNDRERSPDAESALAEIKGLGRRAEFVTGNVFDRTPCEFVVEQAIQAFGKLDILVSNPAYSLKEAFLEISADDFQRVLQGTLVSGFHVSQLVARHMVTRGGRGKIIFISSVHARIPVVQSVAYNAAKAGLNHMAATIAAELVPHRINVNVIEPGWIDTPGEHERFGDRFITENASRLPWGRIGVPADIGKAAAFLASDDADYITGTTLVVDGGYMLKAAIQGS
jgi:glucose 1-dehydrogenase